MADAGHEIAVPSAKVGRGDCQAQPVFADFPLHVVVGFLEDTHTRPVLGPLGRSGGCSNVQRPCYRGMIAGQLQPEVQARFSLLAL